MDTVSVVIISKNEAQNIEGCLRSIKWASEIVLVDQFSQDTTAEIAEKFGARVFKESWKGYAGQKNSAIEKALGSWILSLDADERVPDTLKLEIESVVKDNPGVKGYYIPRKNFFCGKWIRYGGWYPDYNLRLFQRGTGYFQERAVHEKILVEGRVEYLKNPLDHYTYRSIADYLERLERYSRLAAMEMSGRGRWSKWHTLTLRPFFTFLNMYLFRRGILDGSAGLFLAVSYAYYTFLKYYRFYEKDFDH